MFILYVENTRIHTHTHTHARTHARTHTRTRGGGGGEGVEIMGNLSSSRQKTKHEKKR